MYQVQVVDDGIMESANAAADALDEAFQAKKRREHDEEQATMSTALVVRSPTETEPGGAATLSLYKSFIPETLMQQGWLLSAPINVAGKVASRLFGSQEIQAPSEGGEHNSDKEARSLLEELNGLNMRLMERVVMLPVTVVTLSTDCQRSRCCCGFGPQESLEDKVSQLTGVAHFSSTPVGSLKTRSSGADRALLCDGSVQWSVIRRVPARKWRLSKRRTP